MRFRDFFFLPLMFGILSGIMTKAGLPAWVVSLAVGIGAIAIFSGYIDQFAGPMSLWGRAIVVVFVLSAGWAGFYAASPWYLRDAWDSRKEENMMSSADKLRSNEPYTLQQDVYMKEDQALAAEEEIEAAKVRAVVIDPKTGMISDEDREVMNAAKRKIATLRTRRQELKLLMEGGDNPTGSARNAWAASLQVPAEIVPVNGPGVYDFVVTQEKPVQFVKGSCIHFEWSIVGDKVELLYNDGRRYVDGPGILLPHIPKGAGNNHVLRVNTLGERSEFRGVASIRNPC